MSIETGQQVGHVGQLPSPFDPVKKEVKALLEPFHRLYQGDYRFDFETFKWQSFGAWHQVKKLQGKKLDPASRLVLDQVATLVACSYQRIYGPVCKRMSRWAEDGPWACDLEEARDRKVLERFPDLRTSIKIATQVSCYRKEMAQQSAQLWPWQRWSLLTQLDQEGQALADGTDLERDPQSVFRLICE